VQGRDIA
jgi:hypothetical protein